jgi:hypothetical protein
MGGQGHSICFVGINIPTPSFNLRISRNAKSVQSVTNTRYRRHHRHRQPNTPSTYTDTPKSSTDYDYWQPRPYPTPTELLYPFTESWFIPPTGPAVNEYGHYSYDTGLPDYYDPYTFDMWSEWTPSESSDGLDMDNIAKNEACEVALASYSLSILVAAVFLAVEAARIQNPQIYQRQSMHYCDIITTIVTGLLGTGSLGFYLHHFRMTIKSFHDVSLDPLKEEIAAASMIIVFETATLIAWVSQQACKLEVDNKFKLYKNIKVEFTAWPRRKQEFWGD